MAESESEHQGGGTPLLFLDRVQPGCVNYIFRNILVRNP